MKFPQLQGNHRKSMKFFFPHLPRSARGPTLQPVESKASLPTEDSVQEVKLHIIRATGWLI